MGIPYFYQNFTNLTDFILYLGLGGFQSIKLIVLTNLCFSGRTLVHHAVKRFQLILPAIFFKLGIAFTLLIIVTIAVINNSFLGFLLLVVGLSSILARLQESRRSVVAPLPFAYGSAQAHHFLDRSDPVDFGTSQDFNKAHRNQMAYNTNADLRNTGVYYNQYPTNV